MVDIDELERLRGALENIGNLSLDGCIKVNTPHGLWVGTPDAYAREVLGMPWRAPEGHQRMTDTEIRELRAENARLRGGIEKHLEMLEHGYAPFVEDRLSEAMCCSGQMCGCKGASVGEYLAHLLREGAGLTRAALGEPQ